MRFILPPSSFILLPFPKIALNFSLMTKPVIEAEVRGVAPTPSGCAVFLGNDKKVFIIYVDNAVGAALAALMSGVRKERPLTHDLMSHLMRALGAKVERVLINDMREGTYFARLIVSAENELQARKIIELDARPSDAMALALAWKAPIYISREVWNDAEDMSDVLRQMGA